MDILQSVQQHYPTINAAAGELLTKLSGTGVGKDIALAAGLAGLTLLRESAVDLANIPPGVGVLGAVPDEASQNLSRFVFGFAKLNGLDPNQLDFDGIPVDLKRPQLDLIQYEQPFLAVCQKHGIHKELIPFTAAAAAGKLVGAGHQLGLLKPAIGLAMVLFHIAAGSKTVPHAVRTNE